MLNEIRRTETAFENALEFVFGGNWRDRAKWCAGCGAHALMVTPLTAATLEKSTIAEIFRRAEDGELHFLVTAKGSLRICFSSLLAAGREPNKINPFSNFSEA
jgi:hypothetical protein